MLSLSLLAVAPLEAQDVAVRAPVAAPVVAPVSAPAEVSVATPSAQHATVGVRRINEAAATEFAIRQDREPRPVALMIVGGATMLVGTVIGGDAGTIVTIGGAVVFLVGVFRYVD